MAAGWARVNYQLRGGVLTVEANRHHQFRRVRRVVNALLRVNAEEVDEVHVHLLENNGKV